MSVSVTVPTLVRARFRKAEREEFLWRGPLVQVGNGSARDALKHARLPAAAADFLVAMDEKLDAVLGYLRQKTLLEEFPHEGWATELSAERLVLETAAPLNAGERLELLLLLDEFPLRIVPVMAAAGPPFPGRGGTGVSRHAFALEYACAQDEDQEALIRFLFQEERRLLRRRKTAAEEADAGGGLDAGKHSA